MSTPKDTRPIPNLLDLPFLSPSRSNGNNNTNSIPRFIILFGQLILATALMFVLPGIIQYFVRSIDDIYLVLGRTAQSPFTPIPWTQLAIGTIVLLAWHAGLGRLSYVAIMGKQGPRQKTNEESKNESLDNKSSTASWDRILSRIIIPGLLLSFAVYFSATLAYSLIFPKAVIITNTS